MYMYRDIKGANILVDPNGRVKVADFGMAKHVSLEMITVRYPLHLYLS
jgi:serine/threonine protein kinase